MLIGFIALVMVGCREEDKLRVTRSIDPSKMPTLSTRNVLTLISDSGYTKYKVVTPLWNIYNEAKEPYWDFPEGVYLRQLDHDLQVVSTVAADSAKYFTVDKVWKLYGNVEIEQKDKSYFFSQRIFFDDRDKKIYSDTFIHIQTPLQILEGVGFESNMDLTRYRVLKPTGVFPMSLRAEGQHPDSTPGMPDPGPAPVPKWKTPDYVDEIEFNSEEYDPDYY